MRYFVRVITRFIFISNMFFVTGITAEDKKPSGSITLKEIGSYRTGIHGESAAEIISYDKETRRIFITNAFTSTIDAVDIDNPKNPTLVLTIDLKPYGFQANSVAAKDGLVVAAVENEIQHELGKVVFFDAMTGDLLNQLTVGALPDMITFTPNGKYVLVANEGQPNSDYTIDPEGSISIIKLKRGIKKLSQDDVSTVNFHEFNGATLEPSIRISGLNANVAKDLEPEYIAVSKNSKKAWVTLQENNAVAEINIKKAKVNKLIGLGFKDHNLPENGFDASDKDSAINIATHPVKGLFQPDSISAIKIRGEDYIVIANEGDSREYEGTPGFVDEARVSDITLDPIVFPNAESLQAKSNLGRLKIITTQGDNDNDGDYDELFSFGARSFSILNKKGKMIFDSGDQFERILSDLLPTEFNSNDKNESFDSRSDDKGPEPEGITTGKVNGKYYAFIGLERIGGIMVYDISHPYHPFFVEYVNTRNFSGSPELDTIGDVSPEGLYFISKSDSPIKSPLLVVSYEGSGSTTIYEVISD